MRVCGIELKSNNCILTLIEKNDNNITSVDLAIKKIILKDDENQEDIKNFADEFDSFVKKYKVEKISIKKRAKKGNFAGGAVTFKMESIIQALSCVPVELIASATISSYEKKNQMEFPNSLKKYQEQAYLSALISIQ